MNYGETVILAAGDFPRKGGAARELLASAKRVVCCDSAADAYRRRMKKAPTVVVGDCDSVRGRFPALVRIDEQDTNDLAKAVRLCAERGWKRPVILGATGRREDHTIGNVFRALDFGLDVVTDTGRFTPVEGRRAFTIRKGAAISVFATDRETRMTSKGLVWPLDDVSFGNLYCATLNRACATRVTLTATKRVYLYIAS